MTTQRPPSRKKQVLTRLYSLCKARQNFVFTNDEVKTVCREIGFGNPFDATKIDTSTGLPDTLLEADAFVVHLGRGAHRFVFGIENGYHRFEPVPDNRKYQWLLRSHGVLDDLITDERNILYWGYNQRILHYFLYGDRGASPKVYIYDRAQIPLNYRIGNANVEVQKVQVKIYMTLEHSGNITVFEAKNGEPDDFNVFQLFNPFRYYLRATENMSVTSIHCCYLVRPESDTLRLYLYRFTDSQTPGSIELIRNAEYTLVGR